MRHNTSCGCGTRLGCQGCDVADIGRRVTAAPPDRFYNLQDRGDCQGPPNSFKIVQDGACCGLGCGLENPQPRFLLFVQPAPLGYSHTAFPAQSAGNMHSIRNPCDVIHCGTPTVGISEKYENRSSPATGLDYKTSMYVINALKTEAR